MVTKAIQHQAHLVNTDSDKSDTASSSSSDTDSGKNNTASAHLVKLIVAKTKLQSHLLKTIRNLKIVNKNKIFLF